MSGLRTFVLVTSEGEEVRELTTAFGGVVTTFDFPYTTNNEREIAYLLKRGATEKKAPVVLKKPAPPYRSHHALAKPYNYKPLKGGVEK